jgi:hypothetical protein
MKYVSLLLLLNSPLFLASHAALGAEPQPKPEANSPASEEKAPQAPVDEQAQAATQPDSESAKPEPRKKGARPSAMDVVKVRGGKRVLTIHFRWSLFPNSSVEVRLKPDAGAGNVSPEPVYFFEQLKGPVRDALFKCLDHTGEAGFTHTFSKEGLTYTMIGSRNSLGKQAVHVEVHPDDNNKTADKNPAAAYLQLDTWSVDPETLSLDLERDEFTKPGKLYVWFFRGDQIVWNEQIRWPGYK